MMAYANFIFIVEVYILCVSLLIYSCEKCLNPESESGKSCILVWRICQGSVVWSMRIVWAEYGHSMGIVWGHLSVGHIGRSMYLEQATPAIGCWQEDPGCDAGLRCSGPNR